MTTPDTTSHVPEDVIAFVAGHEEVLTTKTVEGIASNLGCSLSDLVTPPDSFYGETQ